MPVNLMLAVISFVQEAKPLVFFFSNEYGSKTNDDFTVSTLFRMNTEAKQMMTLH